MIHLWKQRIPTFLLMAVSLAACSTEPANTAQTTAASQETSSDLPADAPTYLVATDASNAPYELRDEQGKVTGFDIDLINAIAEQQGFKVQVIAQSWTGIFDSLDNGTRHIVVAPITITEERKKLVDFTDPYIYPTRSAFMLPERAQELGVKSFDDLKNVTIAMKDKTTNLTSLQEMFGKDHDKFMPVATQYLAFKDMAGGKVDVGFGDTIVMRYHSKFFPNQKFIQIEQPLKEKIEAGYAVKKGNDELRNKLNAGLKAVRENGTYQKIAEKWFDAESAARVSQQ
ncbi:transporter substrate-binding domain-containing protein [Paralysiella testudinis]|uniref:Amino acid ABC transporter substrate-binding protein n=1 Tax=Paralysiella testudinis TaxID=2809020 RepID=A0A892ZJN3_9NEIS|nr:transporter substrate-binding domain-containing protein [Paralysiella testudinis]QRQ81754.1 amino acid ABC transporter substrate-binding protein [Paralysiella testudinis]